VWHYPTIGAGTEKLIKFERMVAETAEKEVFGIRLTRIKASKIGNIDL